MQKKKQNEVKCYSTNQFLSLLYLSIKALLLTELNEFDIISQVNEYSLGAIAVAEAK